MTTEQMNDLDDEVIDSVPEKEIEDRGDVVHPELEPDALKELVKDEVKHAEPEPEKAAEPEPEPHKDKQSIPKARFDEVNEAKKEFQRQLEEAQREIERLRAPQTPQKTQQEQQHAAAPVFDEDAKEQAYIDAMLDGDATLAKSIRREINTHLRQQAMLDLENNMTQRQLANALQEESKAAADAYPYLDTKDGELALRLIVDARDADIARGVQPHIALRNAVNAIAPRFKPVDENDDTPTKVLSNDKPVVDTRSRDAVKRGADDSIRQPPSLTQGIGNRTTTARVDVESMDEAQFASLTLAEKKRLRGD